MTTTAKVFKVSALVIITGVAVYFGIDKGVPVLKKWFGKKSPGDNGNGSSTDVFTAHGGKNNPGNIMNEEVNGQWVNQIYYLGEQDSTGIPMRYFVDLPHGYGAIFHQLRVYYSRGIKTLRQMITTYAPPSNNPTEAYISTVSNNTGVAPDMDMVNYTPGMWQDVVREIAKFEQGNTFVPNMADIVMGYEISTNKGRPIAN